MYGDNSSVWCGDNELRIATPDIGSGTINERLLQLRNQSTEEIRYTPYQFPLVDGSNGQILTTNGSGNITWQNETAWQLNGNFGTNSSTNFFGTRDSQDLVFRTNNTENADFDKRSSGH